MYLWGHQGKIKSLKSKVLRLLTFWGGVMWWRYNLQASAPAAGYCGIKLKI